MIENADVLGDRRLKRLFGLWRDRHRGDEPPDRSFIDPHDLRFVLGSLVLFDIDTTGPRFRYRLVGTDIVNHLGVELTGLWLGDHPDLERAKYIERALEMSWTHRKAVHFSYSLHLFNQNWPCESLVLPITTPNGKQPVILAGQIFPNSMPRWRRSAPTADWRQDNPETS